MKFIIAICMLATMASAMVPTNVMKTMEGAEMTGMSMDLPAGMNSTQCVFRPEDKMVSCKSAEEVIECPALCDVTVFGDKFEEPSYNIWGIGKCNRDEKEKKDMIKDMMMYSLYPRSMDNSTYMPSFKKWEDKKIDYVLSCSKDSYKKVAGIRVTDCECYKRISMMLESAFKAPHIAELVTGESVIEEIELAGEVMVMDEQIRKRWLFGYGWGMGMGLGWGFGGLGWGFPFWG